MKEHKHMHGKMHEGKMMSFEHREPMVHKMEPLEGGGGRYCEAGMGMDNAKEAKHKTDSLASYAKKHRPKNQ